MKSKSHGHTGVMLKRTNDRIGMSAEGCYLELRPEVYQNDTV